MNTPSKDDLRKYLKFQYWTKYLREQGILNQQDFHRMLCKIRTQYGIC